jgi:hypothetical protein
LSKIHPPKRAENSLRELFHDTLKDIYFAKKNIPFSPPEMVKAAQASELKTAFEKSAGYEPAGFFQSASLLRHLLALLSSFGESNRDRLLAALHLAAFSSLSAFNLSFFVALDLALNVAMRVR